MNKIININIFEKKEFFANLEDKLGEKLSVVDKCELLNYLSQINPASASSLKQGVILFCLERGYGGERYRKIVHNDLYIKKTSKVVLGRLGKEKLKEYYPVFDRLNL